MDFKNIWRIVKNRYRFSTKVQMTFEMSFPAYLVGKCGFLMSRNAWQVRNQKVSPSLQGMVFSDTIPLSWFTSSALVPWEKVQGITIANSVSEIDTISDTPVLSELNGLSVDHGYGMLKLEEPQDTIIVIPWSEKFTDYIRKNKLFDI